MKWYFITDDILTDDRTGFTIRLNHGTWIKPIDISPDKCNLSLQEQAKLLRLGLEFAKDFMTKRFKYTGMATA